MRNPKRLVVPLLLGLALVPAAGAADAKKLEYLENGYATLDPAHVRTANDERLVQALFECLTVLDPATGRAAPGAAEKWEEGADGRSWTFHLRADAVWKDKKPVRAADFAFAWRRAANPDTEGLNASLFRPIRGAATFQDAAQQARLLDRLTQALKVLADDNKDGIPGDVLGRTVTESGGRPIAARLDNAAVKKLLGWGSDKFPPAAVEEARQALREEKRRLVDLWDQGFGPFGKTAGVVAKDDRTLVVETDGWRPYLPELVARAPFAPLREDVLKSQRDSTFEAIDFVGNGPYHLKGRGAKPRVGVDRPESVVHVIRSDSYAGPAPVFDEVYCWTDLGHLEDMDRYNSGRASWMPKVPSSPKEFVQKVEKAQGFAVAPTGAVMVLKFRCDRPPFDRPEVRKAMALAVDRAAIAKRLWPAADVADRIVPPGTRGVQPGPAGPKGDPAAAKKAFTAAAVKPEQVEWIEIFHADDPHVQAVADILSKTWQKSLGLEGTTAADVGADDVPKVQGGYYPVVLQEIRPGWDDPSAFLDVFHSSHPDSLTGWKDAAYDAFIEASHDLDGVTAGPEKVLGFAADKAGLEAKVTAAKSKQPAAREALRMALLVEAERRILDQSPVVPLLYLKRASLLRDLKGLGSEAAWKNPTFAGSLRSATR